MLIDFSNAEESKNWIAVNDDVMGGISQSQLELTPCATAKFSGLLALENNGGFASIRRRIKRESLKNCAGVMLKVKGEPRNYQFRVRTDGHYDGPAYRALFESDPHQWQVITLTFDCFSASFRGKSVPDAPVLRSEQITQIGFLLADKRPGAFCLEIDWIRSFHI